jgi:hypothetical protein
MEWKNPSNCIVVKGHAQTLVTKKELTELRPGYYEDYSGDLAIVLPDQTFFWYREDLQDFVEGTVYDDGLGLVERFLTEL